MPADVIIRPGTGDDAEAIADIHLDSRRGAMPWLAELHSRAETVAYFSAQVLQHNLVMVAEVDRTVAGFLALAGACIEHLYIAPAHQSRGIGGRLLSLAKDLRPAGLELWTFQRNVRARRFYESRGFIASEFTDGSRNEEREPDVLYRWTPQDPRG